MSFGHHIKKKRVLFTRLFAAAVGVLILFSGSRWEAVELYSTTLFSAGAIMVGVATVGRVWCNLYICGRKSSELITAGPYSMCRNPLYFFSLIGAVGLGLTTETISFAVLFLVVFSIYYPFVIQAEEKRLSEIHGAEYQQYRKEIPRFIPTLKRFREPDEYVVRVKLFRRSLLDAMCFVWFIGILEIIEALHESHILPVLIKLY
jgi:protein-S-isoprenylcysteine O-methyltransferase Ste14